MPKRVKRRPDGRPPIQDSPSRPWTPARDTAGPAADAPYRHPTRRVDPARNRVGGPAQLARLEDWVMRLVNDVRRRRGLAVLRPDERLRTSARGHSTRMARLGFFAHHDPDGAGPADRMRAAGHPAPGAENIAAGQLTAAEVMHAWMNSPEHRANILDPGLLSIGVGVSLEPGGPWWTQNFGY
jgi:uncharacterized protein YkwD